MIRVEEEKEAERLLAEERERAEQQKQQALKIQMQREIETRRQEEERLERGREEMNAEQQRVNARWADQRQQIMNMGIDLPIARLNQLLEQFNGNVERTIDHIFTNEM